MRATTTDAFAHQCEQPEPQPPTSVPSGSSSPSSTWNEWPQPQAEVAFGFEILNPDSVIVLRKSTSAPWRYGALKGSTTTVTPCDLELVVALLQAAVEAERVLEAGAAATLHGNAKDVRLALWLQQLELLDLRRRRLRQGDEGLCTLDGGHGRMVAAASPGPERRSGATL